MGYLYKDDRDTIITHIINTVNTMIIDNIYNKVSYSNLNKLDRLEFLFEYNLEEAIDRQYEIYKDEFLGDLEDILDSAIEDLDDCLSVASHYKMINSTEHLLERVSDLKESIFDNVEGAKVETDFIVFLSKSVKCFRDSLINFRYDFHSNMQIMYKTWLVSMTSNIDKDLNNRYNMAETLLILD